MEWRRVLEQNKRLFTLFYIGTCITVGSLSGFLLTLQSHQEGAGAEATVSVVSKVLLSTTTPQRIVDALTPDQVVPATGKFMTADLQAMQLTLYQDGAVVAQYPITAKGKPGTPEETPTGFYTILYKEYNHLNKHAGVFMPYSMQFYGNYFIHGPPFFSDGTPLTGPYSGGCIRLSLEDAQKVYAFAERQTGLFVYDPPSTTMQKSLVLANLPVPNVSADAYLVADAETREVYFEKNAQVAEPIASLTTNMTALVAHETIMFNNTISVPRDALAQGQTTTARDDTFPVGDLLYPLLMESNNVVADRLAQYYGSHNFIQWMNQTAQSLDMQSTHFADANGSSEENVSTSDDTFRLATYIGNKKSFLWGISRTPSKEITATNGVTYHVDNRNTLAVRQDFLGGQSTPAATPGAMVSLFHVPVQGTDRKVVVVVLHSNAAAQDTSALVDLFTQSATKGASLRAACVSCGLPRAYRKIQ